ncbi:MAG: SDR family NAD(P)-dependent oxidoreductase [Longimicrobiales bacterium]
MLLSGKRALVTGGGRGIGAAVCSRLAGEGASVVVSARTPKQIESVAASIVEAGGSAEAIPCDVSDGASVAALAQAAGPVDILVNNAGVATSSKFQSVTLDEWEWTMRVNATGPLLCIQSFLPGMLERGWGRIVNVASIASHMGAKYITSYAASKHALLGLSRCLAAELVGTGVTVNSVCPGYVDTPMTEASLDRMADKTGMGRGQLEEALVSGQPGGRLVSPEEVAHAVMTFLPEDAGAVQGSSLVVDNGGLLR